MIINMQVKITVSSSGKAMGRGMSYSLTLKDVASPEEVVEAFNKELRQYFPPQAKLTDVPKKNTKKE